MFKMVKTELELLPEPGMYRFFEKGRKGEIFYFSNSNSKANKKYLKSQDPKRETKDIK